MPDVGTAKGIKSADNVLALRVSEALTKDVGRGIARIDPADMEKIGVQVGDIIEIKGKRGTVAKVMPTYVENRGKGIIQMDGLIRENAQIGLDEKVLIQKTFHKRAEKIVLSPMTLMRAMRGSRDIGYIGRLLEGLPLTEGDRIRANLFGARSQDFTVISTSPKGAVLIYPETTIRIREEEAVREKGLKVSYEDIGGLDKEIQRIREMIELPLRYPQVFERLGIDAPKGVLLHGPPGCGKTLIARVVANETDAYFTHLSGPEIMHKFYGESESHLRSVFEDASVHAPSIIFLDEIDAIAPKREEMGGERQVERRVVAQLLALMDGLKSRGQVIVIGATNIPNVLDPALRRPGRFDREISISIPDRNGRLEILHIHTRGMPLAEDVDLERLAEITHGFVGADLEALCREAAMVALRKIMPKIEFDIDYIPYETLLELQVTMDNFLEALNEVEPSAIREVFTEIPDVRWDDVGGLEEAKRVLMETIEWPLKYAELFEHAKTKPPKGILLYGPPGTGKTLLAKAVASESRVNFISVKGPAVISKYIGESEKGIREVFRKAKQASPCIVFFDEIDALVPVRSAGVGDSHVTERVISQFLTELDGIEELKGVVVLAATNRLDIIDPALLRAGRFDFLLELPIPDERVRLEIFKVHTRGKPLAKDVHLETLANATSGFVGSDIESICRKASMLAIREFLDQKPQGDYTKFKIAARHFDEALKTQIAADKNVD
ncbi:transitional endoplasmic reticulum ATPase [Candidatus Hakubella thermalkaliphila]|uniref:Transitional endoplasmic reticulum ATPase n=2 Tax=Candidatus Hakubella thermalkaliphila TaxID=2754717 RepID=A0A6V8PQD7_9ACTN|nr:CDC48 family AAA ATPase [Candidatus Hakubella thermalkaliphila]GFP26771.1 transitional endoplasmic reticulum ATPase [Candidatus Hakubella thermalkaliphila]GFP34403.1 transitional endoplasmic reticulum ATPase [Candidatus Hakubella thermalkaliphila]